MSKKVLKQLLWMSAGVGLATYLLHTCCMVGTRFSEPLLHCDVMQESTPASKKEMRRIFLKCI
jgi:hypothetical protein